MTDDGGDETSYDATPPAGDASALPTEPRLQIESGARGAFWQIAFPAMVVLLALSVPLVAWFGKESLLDSRGGKVEAPILDPKAPGYEAVVEPTPTMLLVNLAPDDTLAGVTFLAQAGSTSGSVLFIPVNTVVEVDDLGLPDPATVTGSAPLDPTADTATTETVASETEPSDTTDTTTVDSTATTGDLAATTTPATAPASTEGPTATGVLPLKDIYQLGGTSKVTEAVEKLLGLGIGGRTVEIEGEAVVDNDADAVIELTAERWQELLAPVSPLPVENARLVAESDENGTVIAQYPAGTVELPADGVGSFLRVRNEDESELNRLDRHQAFWTAWLTAVGSSTDPAVIPGEADAGLGGFVRGLSVSEVAFFKLPVDTVSVPGAPDDLFQVDQEAVDSLVATLVPFPVGSDVSPRPRVRVLDGTGTEGRALEAAEILVRAGAEIEIMGNAASFDHVANDVIYYDESMAEAAQYYADALGGGAIALVAEPGEIVELTIVIGLDFDPDAAIDATTSPIDTAPPDTGPPATGADGTSGDD
jgi:hypothetical protein